MSDSAYRNDRDAARARLIELQNELHDRRAHLAELTRRVNLLAPPKKIEEPPRIPHSKLRVQFAAICALLTGYGMQHWIGETNNGRLSGMATTATVFIVVNWFVPWPLRRVRKIDGAIAVDPTRRSRAEEQALEDERRVCEKLEREIADAQHILGSRIDERS